MNQSFFPYIVSLAAFAISVTLLPRILAADDAPAKQQGQAIYLGIISDDRSTEDRGVLIQKVDRDGPADRGWLKEGDLIIGINGTVIRDMHDLDAVLRKSRPGDKLQFRIDRNGRVKQRDVTLGTRPAREDVDRDFGRIPKNRNGHEDRPAWRPVLGIETTRLTKADRRRLSVDIQKGLLVTRVENHSKADNLGIRAGAIIMEVNRTPVANPHDLTHLLSKLVPHRTVELTYWQAAKVYRVKFLFNRPGMIGNAVQIDRHGSSADETADRLAKQIKKLDARIHELQRDKSSLERELKHFLRRTEESRE